MNEITELVITRILIDGSILTALLTFIIVFTLYVNPRLALRNYPEDVKSAVPPRTKKEIIQSTLIAIPFFIIVIGIPLYSTWLIKQEYHDVFNYWTAYITIFCELLIFFLFDFIVLDILMFSFLNPKFLVIPGTEGKKGYKDYSMHIKAHAKGFVMLVIFSALLALIPLYLYYEHPSLSIFHRL